MTSGSFGLFQTLLSNKEGYKKADINLYESADVPNQLMNPIDGMFKHEFSVGYDEDFIEISPFIM